MHCHLVTIAKRPLSEIVLKLPSPFDSILEAVFTVSPNKQYRGIVLPTTPATTGPAKKSNKQKKQLKVRTVWSNNLSFNLFSTGVVLGITLPTFQGKCANTMSKSSYPPVSTVVKIIIIETFLNSLTGIFLSPYRCVFLSSVSIVHWAYGVF